MKRLYGIFIFCLMINFLLSTEITLINDENILGRKLHKFSKNEIYIEKNDTLFVINRNVIRDYILADEDYPKINSTFTINFNSYKKIYNFNKYNIWESEFFLYLKQDSFCINNDEIPLNFLEMMKIKTIDGVIYGGKFFGESSHELKLITDRLLFIPKIEISNIWHYTEHKRKGCIIGGGVGLLLGISVGSGVAQFEGYGDGKKPKYVHPTFAGMIIGSIIGMGSGYLIGRLFDTNKLIWSKD